MHVIQRRAPVVRLLLFVCQKRFARDADFPAVRAAGADARGSGVSKFAARG